MLKKVELCVVLLVLLGFLAGVAEADVEKFPLFSYGIGAGIPAVSVQLGTGKIHFMDSVVPLYVTVNGIRKIYNINSEVYRVAWWVFNAGIGASSGVDSKVSLSMFVIPYSVRINNFSFGIGLQYRTEGVVESKWQNYSVLLPYVNLKF